MEGIGGIKAILGEVFAVVRPHLNERQRRLVLGAAARTLRRGGIRAVAGVTGTATSTVSRGVRELESGTQPSGRVRTAGAGRPRLRDEDPGLVDALLALVEPEQRGDPESPLRRGDQVDPQPGRGADPAGAPGGCGHGGRAAQAGGVLPAGHLAHT